MTKKEQRRELIQESARLLFLEKNIEQTTFSEIAQKAEVGEATVYRHFENKGQLALAIALAYVTDFTGHLVNLIKVEENGPIELFEKVLDYYIDVYKVNPDYYIYLEHFDDFIAHQEMVPVGFEVYEGMFNQVTSLAKEIGQIPNSSIVAVNLDQFIYTCNIAFISLCQKLLLRRNIIKEDSHHEPIASLVMMKDMMMNHMKQF